MSKYEHYLQNRFQPSPNSKLEWLCRLRLAAYSGRRGNVAAVNGVLEAARQAFDERPSADVYVYINFAEAMVQFSTGRLELCLDKLLRANALRMGCLASDEIHLLVLGWLAHIFRIQGEWQKLEATLGRCLIEDFVVSPEALGRVALVFADGFQQTAQYQVADVWYALARESASVCGDDSITGAILLNRPSCRIFNERIQRIYSAEAASSLRMASLEADSALNYSGYVRDESLPWVFDMLHSQVCVLQNSYQQALAHLESEEWERFESDWPLVAVLRAADTLLCKARLALVSSEQILDRARRIFDSLVVDRDWGDVAIVLDSLREATKGLCAEFEMACESTSKKMLARHSEDVTTEVTVFQRVACLGSDNDPKSLAKRLGKNLDQYKIQGQLA